MIYFDHNATSPLSATARRTWLAAAEDFPANPSSPHRLGSRAEVALSEARARAASTLGCSEHDLIFTSGATESNNAILHHASKASDAEAWLSAVEHPSALAAARYWFGESVRLLPVSAEGVLDLDVLESNLGREKAPTVVMLMAANNETGVLQPWKEASALCRAYGVPFACDAAQWIGKETSHNLGACDYVSGCAHKFGGPLGIGFLKVPRGFSPLIFGGPQEDGRRAGTENVPGAVAMVKTWAARESQMAAGEIATRISWRDEFIARLKTLIPSIQIVGERAPRLWNTVSVIMPEALDCRRRWVVQLDKLGFAVSTGSACSSGKEQPSHVLTAMGLTAAQSSRALRFSAGWETTKADWDALLNAVQAACSDLCGG